MLLENLLFGSADGSSESGSFSYLGFPRLLHAPLPPSWLPWQGQNFTPWTLWILLPRLPELGPFPLTFAFFSSCTLWKGLALPGNLLFLLSPTSHSHLLLNLVCAPARGRPGQLSNNCLMEDLHVIFLCRIFTCNISPLRRARFLS